ncbi:MAG: Virginiamycin B lyase [Candidatus Eremiobacteraeota bacterium]|nr:Virginiamycin B lyase [Candidatus Eremiobacteraeota bacterium]
MQGRAFALALCAFVLAGAMALFADPAVTPIPSSALTEYPIKTQQSGARYITQGPDGALWFTQLGASQIGRITTDGVMTEFPIRGDVHPNGIVTGPDGNLWFAETSAGLIGVMTPDGKLKELKPPTAYSGPYGIVVGPDNALWFTEFVTDRIGRVTTDGKFTEYPVVAQPKSHGAPASSATPAPRGVFEITVGPDKNLWFTEQTGNAIGRITPDGTITEFPLIGDNNYPNSIVAGPDGNLWFTEVGTGRIGRVTPAGIVTSYEIPTRHSAASGIAVGENGQIWFSESNAGQIGSINTTTARIKEFALPSPDSQPVGMVLGPDKRLWIVESGTNKVARYAF